MKEAGNEYTPIGDSGNGMITDFNENATMLIDGGNIMEIDTKIAENNEKSL